MKYIFKPLNNLHLQLTSAFYLIGLFFDIGFMVSLKDGFNVHFLITCLVISAIPLLLYIFARLGYPYKYEINNNYLIKYKNKSISDYLEVNMAKETTNHSFENQINNLKKKNKVLLISSIICSIVIIAISVILILKRIYVLAIEFIVFLPFSWLISYYLPVKENKKKINELKSKS